MPTITTTIEDTSPLIIYSGSGGSDWAAGTSANDTSLDQYSQASYMVTSNLRADLSFAFYGNGVQLYGAKRQNHGYYQISIDSVVYPQANGAVNSTQSLFQTSLFSTVALKNGYHTVRMTNMGTAPLDIDFITWQTPVGSANESLLTSIAQDSDDAFKYSSDSVWSANPTNIGMFLGGSGHVTSTAGAFVEYCFKGNAIGIYGLVGPSGAPYSVQLDGGTATNYSSTKASYRPQTMLYYASNLGSKEHTVRLTHTAWNNSALTLAIDYAEVFTAPSLTGGPAPLSIGAIVGIAVGGVLGLLALVVGVVLFLKRRGKGPAKYFRLKGRAEKRTSLIVEPFEHLPESYLDSSDAHTAMQSQPFSTLQSQTSHSQLRSQSSRQHLPSQSSYGHLRSQISHSTIQQTPPTTGLWPSPSGNYEPSPATSPGHDAVRYGPNVQVITVPFTPDGKYRPDLVAPQLHPVPSTTRRNPLPSRPLRPNRGQPLPPGAEPPILALTSQEAAAFFGEPEEANNQLVSRNVSVSAQQPHSNITGRVGAPPKYVS